MQLGIASPLEDARVEAFLDSVFQRPGRESRLVREVTRTYPAFDPGLALSAEDREQRLGWALFVPREMRIRGAWVKLAIAAPIAVIADSRRAGVGRFLVEAGLSALPDRSIRGAVAIGTPEFFGALGFSSAFDVHALRVPSTILPEEGDTTTWVGLESRHLQSLVEVHARGYARVSGAERRHAATIDWESYAENAHTLVHEVEGKVLAFLRFRVRAELEISECAAISPRGVDAVLRMIRRLAREHRRAQVEAHLPPPHAVSRALFRLGAVAESHDLGGAVRMRVVDWPGAFADTSASWISALAACGARSVSLGIEGRDYRLRPDGARLHVSVERDANLHLQLPAGWAPGLLTGQRDGEELLFRLESEGVLARTGVGAELVRALFPGGAAMWTYAPVFEIADD